MIKAIYFDLGGVILRTEDKEPRARLAAEFGMTYDQMDKSVFDWKHQSTAARASIGAITEEAHWISVARRLGVSPDQYPRIRDTFFAGDKIDWSLVNYLREMRKTHKVGLISNAWDGLRAWLRQQKMDDAFDHLTISAEVRAPKPSPAIYQFALAGLGVQPAEAVLVDDFIENVHGAQALGMKAVHFQTAEQALTGLQSLLTLE